MFISIIPLQLGQGWLTLAMAEPPLPATPLVDWSVVNARLEEGTDRITVPAGKLFPRTVPGLMFVESVTPSAIRRRA